MAEQLALADAPATATPAPSAWDAARAAYPGQKVARIIDLRRKEQAFVVIGEEGYGFLMDGSTHFIHVIADMTPQQHATVIAEYDAAWRDQQPDHERRA